MKTIVISGAHSSIGKTLFAEELLHRLDNWSALKVTVKKGSRCPRREANCNVCAELKQDFEIVKNKRIISQKGSDSARLLEAGAKKVIWLKSSSSGLKAGLEKALVQLKSAEGVVIEGTSVLKYIKPNLAIYLKDKQTRIRTAARQAQKKADIIINVDR